MGKHRTIDDRMEALQNQMLQLQAKSRKEEVSADPRVQEIDAEINELNKEALKGKRWGPEWETKVEDFEKRVATWISRGEKADAWLAQYKEDMSALKEKRNLTAAEVAKEMSV